MHGTRTTRKLLVILATLGLLVGTATTAAADQPTSVITLPGGATSRPEGVAVDSHDIYVSSVGNGAIFHADRDDTEATVFLPAGADGRTAATGIKAVDGKLYVSGAGTGKVFVYDLATKALLFSASTGVSPTFVNDVDLDKDGNAYFTDSLSPRLYRVRQVNGIWQMETFVDFTGTAFAYVAGFNANGVVVTENSHYAIVVQSNTGSLYRVGLQDKSVVKIDLGGAVVTRGDGLVLRGQTLYVVRGGIGAGPGGVTKLRLRDHFSTGSVQGDLVDPTFAVPTTGARLGGRLIVVERAVQPRPALAALHGEQRQAVLAPELSRGRWRSRRDRGGSPRSRCLR